MGKRYALPVPTMWCRAALAVSRFGRASVGGALAACVNLPHLRFKPNVVLRDHSMSNSVSMSFFCGCAALSLVVAANDDARGGPDLRADRPPREAIICGPNAVLLFLTMCGVEVADEDVAAIDVGLEGASLSQLSEFCIRHGQPVEIRQLDPNDLAKVPMPAILLSNSDHFHVAYDTTAEGELLIVDPTTGKKHTSIPKSFAKYYSGYVIIRKQTIFDQYKRLALILALFALPPVLWRSINSQAEAKQIDG